jgi:AAA domain/Bifunctional DNA primase/polymerase, N-terminal
VEDGKGGIGRDGTTRVRESRREHPVLAAARAYRRRGWAVVPLKPRDKVAFSDDWPQLRLTEEQLAASFAGRRNIGILTGRASSRLVDVDCDTLEAAAAAAVLLPPTGLVHGRPGKSASHYWFEVVAPDGTHSGNGPTHALRSAKFQFQFGAVDAQGKKKTTLVELRGDGCQTMVPPSIHPCGEQLRWERDGEPGRADWDTLRRVVANIAVCALLVRLWPGQGSRDDAALALTGMLLRGGLTPEEADQLVTLTARIASDEEWPKRAKGQATARRLEASERVWGATKLAELLHGPAGDGAVVVALLRKWLGLRDGGSRRGSPLAEGDHVGRLITFARDDHLRDVRTSGDGAHGGDGGAGGAEEETFIEDVLLSDVREEPVRWLWPGRIPLGKLTILDGDPALGKSLVTQDLAARITTGRPMPDGAAGVEGGVVLLTAEEVLADTVVPNLRAAGGDPTRVRVVRCMWDRDPATGVRRSRPFRMPQDVPYLKHTIQKVDARLLIVDPLMDYLDASVNSWHEQHVRPALAPLTALAEETGIAVLCVRHLNKGDGTNALYRGDGTNALYRGGGSIAIIAVARSGLLMAKDPDDPQNARVLASTKSNLGPPMPSLRLRIQIGQGSQEQDGQPEGEEVEAAAPPTIEWLGTCGHTADALLSAAAPAGTPASTSALGKASAFLREALAGGPRPASEIEHEAWAAEISRGTLNRARTQLSVQATKVGFAPGHWV